MRSYLKQLRCKHEYKTLYNIHGDMINHVGGYRRIDKCTKCGKELLTGPSDPSCNAVNGFLVGKNEECRTCNSSYMGFCFKLSEYLCNIEVTDCKMYDKL